MEPRYLTVENAFLPPAFELIPRLLVLLDDPDVNSEALAEVIRVDPGLTADILHTANAALSGSAARIDTVREALLRLGVRQVFRIVMKIVASPVLAGSGDEVLQKLNLWEHSLAAAIGAQFLARQSGGADPELAFTAALLHDIGKVTLAHTYGPAYGALIETARNNARPLYEAERDTFQVDHAQAGSRLLEAWNFPEQIVRGVEGHHDPRRITAPPSTLAAILYTANILAYRSTHGHEYPSYAVAPDPEVLATIGLDFEALLILEKQILEPLEEVQARFR